VDLHFYYFAKKKHIMKSKNPKIKFKKLASRSISSLLMIYSLSGYSQSSFCNQYSDIINASNLIGNNISKTLDNHLLVVGESGDDDQYINGITKISDGIITKVRRTNGDVVFKMKLGTDNDDRFYDALKLPLGESIVVGYGDYGASLAYRNSANLPANYENSKMYLVKIGSSGNLISQKLVDFDNTLDDFGYSIVQKTGSEFLVPGTSYLPLVPFPGTARFFAPSLLKIDQNLNIISAVTYTNSNHRSVLTKKIIKTNSGDFLILSGIGSIPDLEISGDKFQRASSAEILITKLDNNENVIFSKKISAVNAAGAELSPTSMVELSNGEILICGTYRNNNSPTERGFVLKINSTGSIVMQNVIVHAFNSGNVTVPIEIIRKNSGSTVVGYNYAAPDWNFMCDFDPSLNYVNSSNLSFGSSMGFRSVIRNSSNENFITGVHSGYGELPVIKKTDNISNCCESTNEFTTYADEQFRIENFDLVKTTTTVHTTTPSIISFDLSKEELCQPIGQKITGNTEQSINAFNTILYPNPTNNFINLETEINGEANLKIMNVLGEIVIEEQMTSGSKKINVTDLKAGVYSLIVNSANEQTTIKFIKE
jgi:hypothetical protein